jgi:hypothetical protein
MTLQASKPIDKEEETPLHPLVAPALGTERSLAANADMTPLPTTNGGGSVALSTIKTTGATISESAAIENKASNPNITPIQAGTPPFASMAMSATRLGSTGVTSPLQAMD